DRHLRPPRHGWFEPGADRAEAKLRRALAACARYDAPGHDSALGRNARPRPDTLHRLVEVRDDAGDALAPRLLLGAKRRPRRVLRGGHRPGLRAREPRARARLPGGLRWRA